MRDWGHGTLGEDEAIHGRLVTAYDKKAKEPWYLVTDLGEAPLKSIVNTYRRRWWIETLFRDKKNRDWGLGLSVVDLEDYRRYERLFYIVALAFIFLSAHGAAAEAEGFDRGLKANTRKTRVINLLRIGYHFIRQRGQQFDYALEALRQLVTLQEAPTKLGMSQQWGTRDCAGGPILIQLGAHTKLRESSRFHAYNESRL